MKRPCADDPGSVETHLAALLNTKKPIISDRLAVRMTGIEPAHLAALDPKSSVSTSSTTSAYW